MANVSVSLNLTTNTTDFHYQSNGDIVMAFQLLNADGTVRGTKLYTLKADGSGVYDLATGAQVAASTPANFLTAATALKTQADTALTNAASANKITL